MIARSRSFFLRSGGLALVVLAFCLVLSACSRPLPLPTPGQELLVLTTTGPLTYTPAARTGEDGATSFEVAGLEYDLVTAFAASLEVEVRFVVETPDELTGALAHHKGHLAAAWLTPPEGEDFIAGPEIAEARDVLVQNRDDLPVRRLDQLAGKKVYALAGSRQAETLKRLQDEVKGLAFETIDGPDALKLLEKVSTQGIALALVDSASLSVGLNYYPNLDIALHVGKPYPVTWLFPADTNPELLEKARAFIQTARENGTLRRIVDRYLGHLERLGQTDNTVFLERSRTTLPQLKPHFVAAQEETGIDWRLLAALAYQESGWDPLAISHTNVRGIMMLTEETADRLGVTNRLDARQSILAGARYLALLRQQIPESTPEPDRTWQAMAAYNLGPGNFAMGRSYAQRNNFNPDNWFDMKKALPLFARVSRARGGEAVIMVENVRLLYGTLQRFESPHVPDTSIFEVLGPHRRKPKSVAGRGVPKAVSKPVPKPVPVAKKLPVKKPSVKPLPAKKR